MLLLCAEGVEGGSRRDRVGGDEEGEKIIPSIIRRVPGLAGKLLDAGADVD